MPIRVAQGACRNDWIFTVNIVFFNLAYFRIILALLDKVMVSEALCMMPNSVIRA